MIRRLDGRTWAVEVREGSVARVEGRVPAAEGPLDMDEWKQIATAAAHADPAPAVNVVYAGGANLITGYRLYYMLQFAKQAGVRDLRLHTDGGFWIEEASDWLLDSGVDSITIYTPGGQLAPDLAVRVRAFSRLVEAGHGPRVDVRAAAPGALAEAGVTQ